MMRTCSLMFAIVVLASLAGCVVVKPVVGAGAAVGGAVVKTTAKATTKAAGAAADAVVPDGKSTGDSAASK